VKSVCHSWLGAVVLVWNSSAAFDESRAGDQVMRLEQAVDRGFRDEVASLVGEPHRQLARRQLGFRQCQVQDTGALRFGNAVPYPIGP
jgi:hypothetical protein